MTYKAEHKQPRVCPASFEALTASQQALVGGAEAMMGFAPNDALTLAKVPGLLEASASLVDAVFRGSLDPEVRRLVALMSSEAAGCCYCRGHTRHGALREGMAPERLESLWAYETSPDFTEAQRAAIRVAHHAALTPNQVDDEQFATLASHFSEAECLEIVAVIALFGFLNRWNDTLKTHLEPEPAAALVHTERESP